MTAAVSDLRQIDAADVYLGDDLVARLGRGPNDTVNFAYLPGTDPGVGNVRDRSVAWSLLRTDDYPLVTPGGAVPPFFAGLLPEGVRLGVVTSSTKTSVDDHFTLLSMHGDLGALAVAERRKPRRNHAG